MERNCRLSDHDYQRNSKPDSSKMEPTGSIFSALVDQHRADTGQQAISLQD